MAETYHRQGSDPSAPGGDGARADPMLKMPRSSPLGTEFWEHRVPQWESEKWQGVLRGAR